MNATLKAGGLDPESPVALELAEFARDVDAWIRDNRSTLGEPGQVHAGSVEESHLQEAKIHQRLYESGLARQGWASGLGGLGGSPLRRAVLYDQFSRAGYVTPESFTSLEVIGPTLARFGPDLARRHFPAKLRGEEEWCQGFSEPDAGSDLASLRTRATEVSGGFRIDGEKIWSTFAHLARWCALLARTGTPESRHRGLTLFWVDLQSPGVHVRPIPCASGRNEIAQIVLDGVWVPRDNVIGDLGLGWDAIMHLMQHERGSYAWMRQAWLHNMLSLALNESAKNPRATARLGEAQMLLCALRARSLQTLVRLGLEEQLGPESSIDKILMGTAEQAVFDAIRDSDEPTFIFEDSDWAHFIRGRWEFSRIVTIYGGAIEIQKDIIAQRILGLQRNR